MRPPATEYLTEVVEVVNSHFVALRLVVDGREYTIALPSSFCPPQACFAGATFHLIVQGVDPEEEGSLIDELFGRKPAPIAP